MPPLLYTPTLRRTMPVSATSTEGLIRVAVEHKLIIDYRLSPTRVTLQHDGRSLTLDPEEARFYLRGLIYGYECMLDRKLATPAAAA